MKIIDSIAKKAANVDWKTVMVAAGAGLVAIASSLGDQAKEKHIENLTKRVDELEKK